MNFAEVSQAIADGLVVGEHKLTNAFLRDRYQVSRVTQKARSEISASLRAAGLEVLTDPGDDPLVVRKPAPRFVNARRPARGRPRARKPWAIAAAAIVALLVLITALAPASPDEQADVERAAGSTSTPTPSPTATASTPPSPEMLLKQAKDEIADDDYGAAVAVVTGLSTRYRSRVRRAVSRRIAFRARRALRAGDRDQTRRLLRQASPFSTTLQLRSARSSLTAADTRATQRARARKLERQQRAAARRGRARERRLAREQQVAQEQAQDTPAPSSSSDESAPSVGEGTCAEVGQTDFAVPPGDERDADGDGIACES